MYGGFRTVQELSDNLGLNLFLSSRDICGICARNRLFWQFHSGRTLALTKSNHVWIFQLYSMRAQELRETVSNEKRQAINAQSKVQAHSSKECCRRKAIIRTYSEFVSVAIFIQHAKRTGRIILPSVVWVNLTYFSEISHKQHDFREKLIHRKMCGFILFKVSVRSIFILKRDERDTIINVHRSSCKVATWDINGSLTF